MQSTLRIQTQIPKNLLFSMLTNVQRAAAFMAYTTRIDPVFLFFGTVSEVGIGCGLGELAFGISVVGGADTRV